MNEIGAFPLPDGWVWTTVGAISKRIHYGFTARATRNKIGPKFLRITDVQNNSVNWATVPYCKIDADQMQKYLLREGDIVFARTGATVGKSFLIQSVVPEAVFASYLLRIILPDCVHKRFVFNFFHSPLYWSQISRAKIGIGQPNVNAQILSRIVFPLAPQPEQWRIISKVEELFTKLDAGVKSLETVKAQLKRYRQSVLKSGFDGKLTEEWRRTHRNELEPASKLLERSTAGKHRGPSPVDVPNLPELPEGWAHGKLEDWIYIAGRIGWRGLKAEEYTQEGPLFLSVYNLNHGRVVDLSHSYHISEERYNESSEIQLRNDDILLVKDGAGIGKVGIVQGLNGKATVNSSLLVIRSSEVIEPRFLFYFLQGPKMQEVVKKRITGSATPHLFQRDIKKFDLFIPPLTEQHRIVEEIERCFSVANEVEKTAINSLRQSEKLRQSALKHAFVGKLVPQDPEDEPASMLLERIGLLKSQMEQDQKPKRRRKQNDPKQRRLT